MEIILYESVSNLGTVGDRVNVKPGYARNFLLPQGKAVPATPENVAIAEARRAELEKHEAELCGAAEAVARKLDGMNLSIARKAGEEGKLFGSVGTTDLVEAIAAAGTEITRHDIQLPDGALRQIGEYDIEIRLHADVRCQVHVSVVPET